MIQGSWTMHTHRPWPESSTTVSLLSRMNLKRVVPLYRVVHPATGRLERKADAVPAGAECSQSRTARALVFPAFSGDHAARCDAVVPPQKASTPSRDAQGARGPVGMLALHVRRPTRLRPKRRAICRRSKRGRYGRVDPSVGAQTWETGRCARTRTEL
jgi:hypothetical protein